ncbi:hypothetical protein PU02_0467 [Bartonella ancashensis]|uniref:Uncharacterized protein n=1 Tax=Bartonella ancashensis TaxID=1318743 RepID=A0A0M3T2R0_9HYPH|nr:hypothetical protein PU02_0467 [Bartonella ancashensis]
MSNVVQSKRDMAERWYSYARSIFSSVILLKGGCACSKARDC